jgi:hypothetical protein
MCGATALQRGAAAKNNTGTAAAAAAAAKANLRRYHMHNFQTIRIAMAATFATAAVVAPHASSPLPLLLLLLLLLPVQPAAQFSVHELSFQDLFTSKPQWMLDLNPAGLVPFMAWKHDSSSGRSSSSSSESSWDTQAAVAPAAPAAAAGPADAVVIRESLVCNEYLEDNFSNPPVSALLLHIEHNECT